MEDKRSIELYEEILDILDELKYRNEDLPVEKKILSSIEKSTILVKESYLRRKRKRKPGIDKRDKKKKK